MVIGGILFKHPLILCPSPYSSGSTKLHTSVLKLEQELEYLEVSVSLDCWARVSDSLGLGKNPKIHISNRVPGHVERFDPYPHFGNQGSRNNHEENGVKLASCPCALKCNSVFLIFVIFLIATSLTTEKIWVVIENVNFNGNAEHFSLS